MTQYLSSFETETLISLRRRTGPQVGSDLGRLECLGLVEFVKETRSGTTWYKITPLGRMYLDRRGK
jgi:hypothetical protein